MAALGAAWLGAASMIVAATAVKLADRIGASLLSMVADPISCLADASEAQKGRVLSARAQALPRMPNRF